MPTVHAYFSKTQKIQNGIVYIYFKEDGKEIECTEVSPHKPDDITRLFSDNIYLGEVVKFSHSIKDENYVDRKITRM
jgi:hypothetical protein